MSVREGATKCVHRHSMGKAGKINLYYSRSMKGVCPGVIPKPCAWRRLVTDVVVISLGGSGSASVWNCVSGSATVLPRLKQSMPNSSCAPQLCGLPWPHMYIFVGSE